MKKNRYIVVRSGVNKEGKPYSQLWLALEGISKNTGNPYALLNENNVKYLDETLPLGKFVSFSEQRVDDDWEAPAEAKK